MKENHEARIRELKQAIEKIATEERGFLSAHRVNMEQYENTHTPRFKQVASQALDRAEQHRRRRQELENELRELEAGASDGSEKRE